MTDPRIFADLNRVGFFATANDYASGRYTIADVIRNLRRDASGRNEENRIAVLALADQLEQTEEEF